VPSENRQFEGSHASKQVDAYTVGVGFPCACDKVFGDTSEGDRKKACTFFFAIYRKKEKLWMKN